MYLMTTCITWKSASSSEEDSPSPSDSAEGGEGRKRNGFCLYVTGRKEEGKGRKIALSLSLHEEPVKEAAGRNTRSESETKTFFPFRCLRQWEFWLPVLQIRRALKFKMNKIPKNLKKKFFKNVFIPFIYLSIHLSGEIYLTWNITIRNTNCASEKCPDWMDLFRMFNIRNTWLRLTNKPRPLVLHPHAGVHVLPPSSAKLYKIPWRAQLSEDAAVSPVEKWKQLLRTFSVKRNFSLIAEKKNKNLV